MCGQRVDVGATHASPLHVPGPPGLNARTYESRWNMTFSNRQFPFGFSILFGALLLWTIGDQDLARADQLDDACRSKCNEIIQAQKDTKGGLPPQDFFTTCVDACKRAAMIKSEADIPGYCRASCQEALRKVNLQGDAAKMKECTEKCVESGVKSFRKGRSQQQKAP
jgi:hypothetical protein